jgi:hypothetical protein
MDSYKMEVWKINCWSKVRQHIEWESVDDDYVKFLMHLAV